MKKKVNKRQWLNPIGSDDTGALSVAIEYDTKDRVQPFFYAGLQVRDCGRQIGLSFNADYQLTEKKLNERIVKCDKLLDYGGLIKAHLEKVQEEVNGNG